jgi:hypothetical protein
MITAAKGGFPGFDANAATNFLESTAAAPRGTISDTALDLLGAAANLGDRIGEQVASGNGIEGAFNATLQFFALPFVEAILYTLQWVAINLSEAALIMTALFAPIALAMSLMPIAGRMIFAWIAGFVSILAYQLGYNILVGLMAFVIINMEQTSETLNGLGFLFFSALGAPWIAAQMGQGGGVALYQGLSRQASGIVDGIANAVRLLAKAAIAAI